MHLRSGRDEGRMQDQGKPLVLRRHAIADISTSLRLGTLHTSSASLAKDIHGVGQSVVGIMSIMGSQQPDTSPLEELRAQVPDQVGIYIYIYSS